MFGSNDWTHLLLTKVSSGGGRWETLLFVIARSCNNLPLNEMCAPNFFGELTVLPPVCGNLVSSFVSGVATPPVTAALLSAMTCRRLSTWALS